MPQDAVQIKGNRKGLVIRLYPRADLQAIKTDLTSKLESANGFFAGAKFSLHRDQQALPANEQQEIEEILRRYGLVPAMTMPLTTPEPSRKGNPVVTPERPLPSGTQPAQIVRQGLRSGQSVTYAGSVLVLGDVNMGAKVEAEGSVLVFGRCRGTVMAGTNGNRKARVVCHSFHGTLVAIADIIGYPEAPSEPNQFIAASLQGDQIVVNPA